MTLSTVNNLDYSSSRPPTGALIVAAGFIFFLLWLAVGRASIRTSGYDMRTQNLYPLYSKNIMYISIKKDMLSFRCLIF